jgi:hypothetical protein
LSGDRFKTTSTTTYTLQAPGGTGTITVGLGLAYSVAQSIIIAFDANNHNEAEVTSYDPLTGSISFIVFRLTGSGTYSSWSVNIDGASGGDGSSGSSGTSGTSATAGTSGTTGTSGSSGTSGTTGTSGSSGSSGTSAVNGTNGTSGTSGTTGTSGSSGTSGTTGTSGSSGTSGTSATNGTGGTSGTSGSSGSSGTTGTSGTSATSGTSGTSATSGTTGTSGTSGTNGTGGTSGTSGTSATSGTSGTSGSSGATQAFSNVLTMNNSGSGDASGSTYNGSAPRTISHNTIGALALSGGTMTGILNLLASQFYEGSPSAYALNAQNSDIIGINGLYFNDPAETPWEGLNWYNTASSWDSLWSASGVLYYTPNRTNNTSGTSYTVWTTQTLISPVTGSGTTNYLTKWTGSSSVGNSGITDDGTTITTAEALYLTGTSGYNITSNSDIIMANAKPVRGYTTTGSGWRLISIENDNKIYIAGNGGDIIMNGGGSLGVGLTTPTSVAGAGIEIFEDTNGGTLSLSRNAGNQRGILRFGRNNGGTFQTAARIIGDSDGGTGANGSLYFQVSNSSSSLINALQIASTGAATFISSVTATSFVKTGGTSAQYLKADGSVSTLTNPVTGTGVTQGVAYWTSTSEISSEADFAYEASNNRVRINSNAWDSAGAEAKLIVSGVLSAGSSATVQINGFVRIKDQLLIHNGANTAQDAYIQAVGQGVLTVGNKLLINTTTVGSYQLDVFGSANNVARFVSASGDALVRVIANNYGTEATARFFLGENDTLGMTFEYDGNNNIGHIGMNDSVDPTGAFSKRISMPRGNTDTLFNAGRVGIGITPSFKFDIGNVGGSAAAARLYGNDQSNVRLRLENVNGRIWELTGGLTGANNSTFTIYDVTATATRLQIDSSGNLGLGTTPSPWTSAHKVFQFGAVGSIETDDDAVALSNNRYFDGINKYRVNDFASILVQVNGEFRFLTAPSGIANNAISFTTAMMLNASGNLMVGTTSAVGRLTVQQSTDATNGGISIFAVNGEGAIISRLNDGGLTFRNGGAERMRLDTLGNLGLGVTPSAWGSDTVAIQLGGSVFGAVSASLRLLNLANAYTDGTNFRYINSGVAALQYRISGGTGAHEWYNAPSGTAGNAISFTQAMTLFANGDLAIGATSSNNSRLRVVADWNSGFSTVGVQGLSANQAGYGLYNIVGTRVGVWAYTGSVIYFETESSGINMNFNPAGITSMTLHGNGNVSIGRNTSGVTQSDIYLIPSSANSQLYFGRLSSTNDDNTKVYFQNRVGTATMYVDTGGQKVGIGLTSPTALYGIGLEIFDDTGGGTLSLSRNAGGQRGVLRYGRNNGGSFQEAARIVGNSDAGTGANGNLYFQTTNSAGTMLDRMIIFPNNRIAMNASSANGILQISGSHVSGYGMLNMNSVDSCIIAMDSSGSYDVRLRYKYNGTDLWFAGMQDSNVWRLTKGDNTSVLYATQGNNVYIPNGGLQIASEGGFASSSAKLLVGDIISGGSGAIAQFNGFLRIRDQIIIHRDSNTAQEIGIQCTGSSALTIGGSVTASSFFESSDARLKSNINDFSIDVSSIKAKIYEKDGKVEVGYLAQDVENILSGAVSKRDNGYLDLSYRQVHTAKIAALEEKIKELEQQLKNK